MVDLHRVSRRVQSRVDASGRTPSAFRRVSMAPPAGKFRISEGLMGTLNWDCRPLHRPGASSSTPSRVHRSPLAAEEFDGRLLEVREPPGRDIHGRWRPGPALDSGAKAQAD